MLDSIKQQLQQFLAETLTAAYPDIADFPSISIETPAEKTHGDFSTNIALKSAKIFRKAPMVIAEELAGHIKKAVAASPLQAHIQSIEIKNPGFINFFLTQDSLFEIIEQVFEEGGRYGVSDFGKKEKIQIEFVSANPTGPLSVAHARQAVVGDVLGNVLTFLGFDVTKEYYVNDEGNQINILGTSIKCRALQHLGLDVAFPEEGYQGDYIKDMAQIFLSEKGIADAEAAKAVADLEWNDFGVRYLMDVIKRDLDDFGVHFDYWAHQREIATDTQIEKILDLLKERGHLYEEEGALWFKSSAFGDDKDRVVKKSDGAYTYLTPDIVYHKDKFERGFSRVFNIWGPDHHGYIPRIKAAAEALGKNKDDLEVLIVQLATLFRDGKPVSMSTRRGEFISLREVMEEVGTDAARFFFLMRHIKAHLEFDLELAKKQTNENPVYYIQYAHARVYSVNKKADEVGIKVKSKGFSLLKEPEEIDLIKKMGEFPETLQFCYNQLDPYPLVSYMQDLAAVFHKFYDHHRVIDANEQLSAERLSLMNAARIVFANGLGLLGVQAPEQM
ncbi:MAG: arginine--tRNA ligase [Candidatus Omnitrophica bacterium]|nr:arginine--tRNA ligase [Candidatus Omnitrophota bacterium]